jgi:class 3 adenylate cyclase
VTFLLTDVEGSTRLWEQSPDGMRAALVRHDALIEGLVTEHGGTVVRPRGEGDSRFAVFTAATDAVEAACLIQIALAREAWPLAEPLRVRMAIHTSEADQREGDYYGRGVNRCARLRALARGGQILVSGTTAMVVRDQPLTDVTLKSLGRHKLKDVVETEQVFQVCHPELPGSVEIFVCHDGEVTPAVEELVQRLTAYGMRPFLESRLPPHGGEQDLQTGIAAFST